MSLKRNTGWNLVGSGAPLLVGLFAVPYLVENIGVEAFGILTLIWALIGYFSLFDFGLGRALTQQIAHRLGSAAAHEIHGLARVGLIFTLATGVLGGLTLVLLADELARDWLNVSPSLEHAAHSSLLIAAAGIPLATITTGARGIVEAYQDFKSTNLVRLWLGVGTFGLPVVSVWLFGPSLEWTVIAMVTARLGGCVAQWRAANQKLRANWQKAALDWTLLKALLSQGLWMTASNLIGPLVLTMDRFVIATFVTAGAIAYYSIPSEIVVRLLIIPSALAAALFPQLASVLNYSRGEAIALYRRSLKTVAAFMAPICVFVAIGAKWALGYWINPEFAAGAWVIVSILSLGILFNSIAFVPFAIIQASGRARITALVNIVVLMLYLPVLLGLVGMYGTIGAAWAWVFRALVDMVLLLYLSRKLIGERRWVQNNLRSEGGQAAC